MRLRRKGLRKGQQVISVPKALCGEKLRTTTTSIELRQARFECHVLPHVDILYRVARSMTKSPHDAEDLVQETMLRAYRAIDRFDGRFPKAWLLTILRNEAVNRSRKRTPGLLRDPDATLETVTSSQAQEDAAEDVALAGSYDTSILDAFQSLPEKFRTVAHLVDVQGMSYQEAADVLEVPVGTIMSRLHRARNKLRKKLSAMRPQYTG